MPPCQLPVAVPPWKTFKLRRRESTRSASSEMPARSRWVPRSSTPRKKKKGRVGHEAPSRQAIAAKILGDLQSTSFQRQFNSVGKILQEKLTIQEAKSFGLAKTWSQMYKDAQLSAPLKELMKKVQIVWTVQGREMEQKNVEKSTAEATSEEHI